MSEAVDTTVLLIGGTGQNGATLLSRLLAAIPGFVAVGELGFLWDRALQGNLPCGCGVPFHACPFWVSVGEAAFGGWERVDPAEAVRLRAAVLSRRRHLSLPLALPLMVRPDLSPRYRQSVERYAELIRRVYRGIRAVSGAGIIVDSTKVPGHAFTLWNAGGVNLRVVHLVRDSRGVALSNLKLVPRQSTIDGRRYRGRHAPIRTAARWLWINLAYELLAARGVPVMTVLYEDLARNPRGELARLSAFAGAPVDPGVLEFVRDGEAELPVAHLVAGNRLRLRSGQVAIRPDEEWRTALSRRQRAAVLAVTAPLLYRYRWRSGRPGSAKRDRRGGRGS
jgi:hypothetical protein